MARPETVTKNRPRLGGKNVCNRNIVWSVSLTFLWCYSIYIQIQPHSQEILFLQRNIFTERWNKVISYNSSYSKRGKQSIEKKKLYIKSQQGVLWSICTACSINSTASPLSYLQTQAVASLISTPLVFEQHQARCWMVLRHRLLVNQAGCWQEASALKWHKEGGGGGVIRTQWHSGSDDTQLKTSSALYSREGRRNNRVWWKRHGSAHLRDSVLRKRWATVMRYFSGNPAWRHKHRDYTTALFHFLPPPNNQNHCLIIESPTWTVWVLLQMLCMKRTVNSLSRVTGPLISVCMTNTLCVSVCVCVCVCCE